MAFWKAASDKQPALRPFIQPEINRLQGVTYENLVTNGGFEEGTAGTLEPGNPPDLPGWWFYDHVGMVRGSTAVYDWREGTGRDGGRAIGCGPGRYPGLRAFVQAEAGRYRFSFWYRTVNRDTGIEASVFQLRDDVKVGDIVTAETVRALQNEQYIKFLRRSWPPTEGAWRQVTQTFTLDSAAGLAITLEPFSMPEGAWVWFDDVELEKLY